MKMRAKLRNYRENYKNSQFNKKTAPKLLSLLFAIMLWLVVIDLENPELEKNIENIPVILLNEAEVSQNGMIILDREDYYIDVKVKGRRNEVAAIKNSDIRITADLRGFDKGVISVPLNKRIYSEDVVITDLSQSEIKVVLDQIVEIAKPVTIEVEGEIPVGYSKDNILISPEEVLVKGPESIVNRVSKISGMLSIDGVSNSISKEIPLKAVDNDLNDVSGVTLGKEYVSAELSIYKLKKVPVVYMTSGDLSEEYRLVDVELLTQFVTIKGEQEVIDKIESLNTTRIDVSGKTESFTEKVKLVIPENVETTLAENAINSNITIEKMSSKEFRYFVREIPIFNLDPNLEANITNLEDVVKITLYDVESKLSKINGDILNPILDGSHFIDGVNSSKVEIDAAVNVEKYDISPDILYLEVVKKVTSTNNDESTANKELDDASSESSNNTGEKVNANISSEATTSSN